MLIDIDSVDNAVLFAQRIARMMSKDPEVDSIAGEAAWRALYTYDKERGVKLSWWIAQLTKQSVVHYWRRMAKLRKHEKFMDDSWWAEQSERGRISEYKRREAEGDNLVLRITEDDTEIEINAADWQLLVESFLLEWPLDIIDREHGISLGKARRMRRAAMSRLETAC